MWGGHRGNKGQDDLEWAAWSLCFTGGIKDRKSGYTETEGGHREWQMN